MAKKKYLKVNLTSTDLSEQQLADLRRILPEAFSENKIDFEKLRTVLGDKVDNRLEKFGFTWAGKSNAIKNVLIPSKLTLKPKKDESVKFDESENIFIEGDNLEALKLLQKSYFEKVKMIYIDPPYNTGGDFVYKDNFSTPLQNYKEQTGQVDSEGNKFQTNKESNGRYHSDWLSMMYPRLKLAWNFLHEDGVIFVSIDDNEVHHLRMVMDEIFGEENFLGCSARVTKKSNNKGDFWAPNFDYILTYAKVKQNVKPFFGGVNYEAYDQIETEGKRKGEKYQLVRLYMSTIQNRNPEQRFFIECPDGSKIIPPGSTFPPERPVLGDGIWRWTRKKLEAEKDKIVIKKVKSSNLVNEDRQPAKWNVYTKTYLNDVIKNASAKPNSLVENHINQIGSHELGAMNIPFDYSKPSTLIKYLIEISRIDKKDIILDFFAGSSTTAQAVLQKNSEDNGDRKFILIQIPEKTDEKSEAHKAGYKTIADIAKERIRRVIKGYGDNPKPIDDGFKVFKLDQSNYRENEFDFDPSRGADENEEAFKEYLELVKQTNLFGNINELDVVYENIIKEGLSLNSKIKEMTLGNNKIYHVSDDTRELFVCLDNSIASDTIKAFCNKEYKEKIFICIDNALDDSAKANLGLNLKLKTI